MISLLPLFLLTAALPSGTVSSTSAEYDGKGFVLQGDVQLSHSLGKMWADAASLQREEEKEGDFPFSLIQLDKNVVLSLSKKGELHCDHAHLDFAALKGELTSEENSTVRYVEQLGKKIDGSSLFALQGKQVDLNFKKEEKGGYSIDTLLARQGVLLTYGSCRLTADRALYRHGKGAHLLKGLITAYPKEEGDLCRLEHEGDLIEASSVDFDLDKNRISFHHPKGRLASTLIGGAIGGAQKEPLRLSADLLIWDKEKNRLTLKGNAHVQEPSLGSLAAVEELSLVQGKLSLEQISSHGKTLLIYKTPEGAHKFLCHGNFLFDRQKLRGTASSPRTEGIVLPKEQIYYEQPQMGIFANDIDIEYTASEEDLLLAALTLKGNVRLFSRRTEQKNRCAIADRLHYSVTSHTLVLAADPTHKVLFWDEAQALQISAQEVHITIDPETQKETVQGIGNVKFLLTPEEHSLLGRLIPQQSSKGTS